jgi:hypothetical protein
MHTSKKFFFKRPENLLVLQTLQITNFSLYPVVIISELYKNELSSHFFKYVIFITTYFAQLVHHQVI